ncbi:DUF488 domain-containing protein [Corynebacterium anserum]|uniref:DUF488 family protein n=1 Tax=Corynebacterium anserum TaxID=2684406 RepID=A0A7G7YPB5_9CORY|nr:DUF488 family protein [Corynebacterium anserum]QNH96335.1 DUF488 family protein [Corynebacterium anserum]
MAYIQTVKIHDLLNGNVDLVGTEVLVDRLWPRGVKKNSVKLHAWLKEVALSPELRQWFNHEQSKFEQFRKFYIAELDEHADEIDEHTGGQETESAKPAGQDLADLCERARRATEDRPLVLVFAANDREVNHAVVLAEWLCGNVDNVV